MTPGKLFSLEVQEDSLLVGFSPISPLVKHGDLLGKATGLMAQPASEVRWKQSTVEYFPHFLGHHLIAPLTCNT